MSRNCWEDKNCGRIQGGQNVGQMGVCPAYPDHGRDCWKIAGTFCGGQVQGSEAQKVGSCLRCEFFQGVNAGTI